MPMRILVVDDSRATRRFLGRVLELSGLPVGQILQAADGLEALTMLRSNAVDLILADINMPNMNGEQFLVLVQSNPETSLIPVIIVSSDSTDSRKERMLSLGARGYVPKPVTPEMFRNEFERVFSGSRSPAAVSGPVQSASAASEPLLTRVTAQALENMCFLSLDGVVSGEMSGAEDSVSAQVQFSGDVSGWLGITITYEAAIAMTASFFGADESENLPPDQIESFTAELANVICGALLASYRPDGRFELSPPEIVHEIVGTAGRQTHSIMTWLVEGGAIRVGLSIGLAGSMTPGERTMAAVFAQP